MNRPFIMVASVGSDEDAQTNINHLSEDWKVVMGRKVLKKLKKNKQVEISKSEKFNQNAMRIFVKAAEQKEIIDEEEKEEKKIESVPHKQFKAEAPKKKKKTLIKFKKASVTTKEFSNKKFQKLLDQGVKELKDFYKIPCISKKVISLGVDIKQTLKYLEKQLEFYDMMKDFQIARLPKYFRPYAELHFKKAFDGKLPDNVMDNPKHIFHIFHKIGRQKKYSSTYKAHLHHLLLLLSPAFDKQEDFDEEKFKFDESTEWFFGTIGDQFHEDEKMHIFNTKKEKQNKNQKNKESKYKAAPVLVNEDHEEDLPELIAQDAVSISTAGSDSDDSFDNNSDDANDDIILEFAFGAQVTFIDDNNNVVTLGGDLDNERIEIGQEGNPRETNGFIDTEMSNIAIRNSNSEMSEDDELVQVGNNMQGWDEDTKPSVSPLKPEGKSNDSTLLRTSTLPLPSKIPPSTKNVSNEEILTWLEKQNPILADSFANDFKISTTKSIRLPKMSTIPSMTPSSNKMGSSTTINNITVVENLTKQYQELNEDGQKDLWLGALASNNTDLIQALTNIRLQNNNTNSKSQLAKLTKELLTHSEKHKVTELKYEEQAGKRRLYFHNWLTRLSAVIKMFSQTAPVLDAENNIIEYADSNCVGNQALYMLLCSKVDNFYRTLIQRQHNHGDKALSLLKSYCASCTIVDKNHFHREFTNLRIQNEETATHFLKRFTIARTKAVIADNKYSDDEVVDLFLAAFTQTKNIQYMYVTQHFLSMRQSENVVSFHDLEKRLLAIDESSEREKYVSRKMKISTGLLAEQTDTSEQANAANTKPLICYNCGKPGHKAPECKEPKRQQANQASSTGRRRGDNGRNGGQDRHKNQRGRGGGRGLQKTNESQNSQNPQLNTIVHGCSARVVDLSLTGIASSPLPPMHFWAEVDGGYEETRPEPSEEGTVTVNASLSRSSSLVSEVQSDDSQNLFFRRQYHDTNPPQYFDVRRTASAIDVQLSEVEELDDSEYVASCSDSETESMADLEDYDWIACTHNACNSTSLPPALSYAVKVRDPSLDAIGDPANLNNYLPDSGATQHMTPRREDLYDAVEGQNLGVEVADGHIIRCSTTGKVKVSMLDDNGQLLIAELQGCMYVPGLSRRLFSITKFASNGHRATITKDKVTLFFGSQACPVTIPLCHGINIANNIRIVRRPLHPRTNLSHEPRLIPDRPVIRRGENHIRYTNLSLLHDRLGHRAIRTLLAADEHGVWQDTRIRMEPENDCVTCQIATIRATARNKHPHTPAGHPGATVFMDILPCKSSLGLTPKASYAHCLILVDAFSRFSVIYGLRHKTTQGVVDTILQYGADHRMADEYGFLDIDRVRADAGSEFTSGPFKQFCATHKINLSLAAPKRQDNNHLAERSWQTIHRMARSMLVHARLPDQYHYHAIRYAASVFNILPVKNLYNAEGEIASPHELFCGAKPTISQYRVFGCPVVAKRWVVSIDGRETIHCTEKGIRGIFIGFPPNQKGYLIFLPGSRTIAVSGDVMFDETFYSAIATTWRRFEDGIALQPERSAIPGPDTTVEMTGDISDQVHAQGDEFFDAVPHQDDVSSTPNEHEAQVVPVVVDDGQPLRPQRNRRPPRRLSFDIMQRDRDWQEVGNACQDMELARACASEATVQIDSPGADATVFEPAPSNLRAVLKIRDAIIREAWLRAYRRELKTLIESGTFRPETPLPDESSTPIMDLNVVKLRSDGTLDKLKNRLVVRGDLQKNLDEDKWSPTASFRALKLFLAHAARLKVRVRQLDFVGAFLQAKVRRRIFVTIPAIYGSIFPEFKQYCGTPLRLLKAMYGMTLSGKFWYQDLLEFLVSIGFNQSTVIRCLFFQKYTDGSVIFILNYVDDMLYYGTSDDTILTFETKLSARFNLETKGQAHWYLATRITQLASYDIILDQTRYCKSVIRKYLDSVGCKNVSRKHTIPLPCDFVPTSEDCSESEDNAALLVEEYKLDYASCIGSLIYLSQTRTDIIFAVNKLARYMRKPGKAHFDALVHLLRYLRDNNNYGVRFFSDYSSSPLYQHLNAHGLPTDQLLVSMSDSSWNDDVDTGRSTGCFLIFYMGGVVDHSSNMPDPVALSSAEAEYNQACIATMALMHISMAINNLELLEEDTQRTGIPLILDSSSAIAIGSSFKDTKHTRHIMRRYHFVRSMLEKGFIILLWINTKGQLADIGTKVLGTESYSVLLPICMSRISVEGSVQEG